MMEKRRWFETRAFKLVMSVIFYAVFLLFVFAGFGTGETGFKALYESANLFVAILVSMIPLAAGTAYAYFYVKDI